MIGQAMSDAFQNQKRKEKEEMKQRRKEERAKEKEERRAAKKEAKETSKEIAKQRDSVDAKKENNEEWSDVDNMPAESLEHTMNNNSFMGGHEMSSSNFDDID